MTLFARFNVCHYIPTTALIEWLTNVKYLIHVVDYNPRKRHIRYFIFTPTIVSGIIVLLYYQVTQKYGTYKTIITFITIIYVDAKKPN